MQFEFSTSPRIVFGCGTRRMISSCARELGSNCLVVTGKTPHRWDEITQSLEEAGVSCTVFQVPTEPTVMTVRKGAEEALAKGCDLVAAIGGGSVMDAAKAISAMMTNPGDLYDYLEVVGRASALKCRPSPVIAVPTTAGTGSEVTKNAVIISKEHRLKVSLRSPLLYPAVVIVDPELTLSLPPGVTASTGLDALTQLLEAYVSNAANPITDSLCREGLARSSRSLHAAYLDGRDMSARTDMCVASLLSGMALANARLGAVHGFAAAIGGLVDAPHGLVCAALVPHVVEMNVRALAARGSARQYLERFDDAARIVTGSTGARAQDLVAWLRDTCSRLSVPGLRDVGVHWNDLADVAAKAQRASSMKGNPVELSLEELVAVLSAAW